LLQKDYWVNIVAATQKQTGKSFNDNNKACYIESHQQPPNET